jgi:hypothetical protein
VVAPEVVQRNRQSGVQHPATRNSPVEPQIQYRTRAGRATKPPKRLNL